MKNRVTDAQNITYMTVWRKRWFDRFGYWPKKKD